MSEQTDQNDSTKETAKELAKELGRNEPCHCGSGKKYKRCHGVGAAPKFTPPKSMGMPEVGAGANAMTGAPGGFDPSKMDPAMMMQFTQALQRLPKGQLQKLQGIMQRAMSGKDVTQDAAEFEKSLPPDLQQLMFSFAGQMQGMGGMGMGAGAPAIEAETGMTEDQAREIVAAAAAEGKVSKEEAEKLLAASSTGTEEEKKNSFSKFWRGISGKSS